MSCSGHCKHRISKFCSEFGRFGWPIAVLPNQLLQDFPLPRTRMLLWHLMPQLAMHVVYANQFQYFCYISCHSTDLQNSAEMEASSSPLK